MNKECTGGGTTNSGTESSRERTELQYVYCALETTNKGSSGKILQSSEIIQNYAYLSSIKTLYIYRHLHHVIKNWELFTWG